MPIFDIPFVHRETGAELGVCRVSNAESSEEAIAAARAAVGALDDLRGVPFLIGPPAMAHMQSPEPRWRVDAEAADFQSVGSFLEDGEERTVIEFDPRIDELLAACRLGAENAGRTGSTVADANLALRSIAQSLRNIEGDLARVRNKQGSVMWGVFWGLVLFTFLPGMVLLILLLLLGVVGAAGAAL